ncbi:hypothetical protein TKK_0007423 [Trichogramma kaykai]
MEQTNIQIQTFRTTTEQFKDFSGFIRSMEEKGAHLVGIAKIIPPAEWIPRKSGYKDLGRIMIKNPIAQKVVKVVESGSEGINRPSLRRVSPFQ